MKVARSSGREAWFWSITGPVGAGSGIRLVGETEALKDAKAAFRETFERLKYWAGMSRNGEISGHVGAKRVGRSLPNDHQPDTPQ